MSDNKYTVEFNYLNRHGYIDVVKGKVVKSDLAGNRVIVKVIPRLSYDGTKVLESRELEYRLKNIRGGKNELIAAMSSFEASAREATAAKKALPSVAEALAEAQRRFEMEQ